MIDGCKLKDQHESPIDNLIHHINDHLAPVYHEAGFTPNHITTLSYLCGVASIIALIRGHHLLVFASLYMLSYYFDCLDGLLARRYKQGSKFGDWYDHITDWAVFILLVITLVCEFKLRWYHWLIIAVVMLGTGVQFACQEVYHDKSEDSPALGMMVGLCPVKTKEGAADVMVFTRWIGGGMVTIFFILFVCYAQMSGLRRHT